MSDKAPFGHPPSSRIPAPALRRQGARPPRCLPAGNCCQETAAPALWWPRIRPSPWPLIPRPTSQAQRRPAHSPTKTLLKRCSLD
jgi:hypothetical protein